MCNLSVNDLYGSELHTAFECNVGLHRRLEELEARVKHLEEMGRLDENIRTAARQRDNNHP